jgi:KUP system potassium uptake protein
LVLLGGGLAVFELPFFAGNVVKVVDGGWVPLAVALTLFVIMTTWRRGRQQVVARVVLAEGSIDRLAKDLRSRGVVRVPGTAVFPHPSDETVPAALRANVERNNVLHKHVVIVSVRAQRLAHVATEDALKVRTVGSPSDGIAHVDLSYGFFDRPDIPGAVAKVIAAQPALAGADAADATYFLSRPSLEIGKTKGMAKWRKHLFLILARNAADPDQTYGLPPERTVTMGTALEL